MNLDYIIANFAFFFGITSHGSPHYKHGVGALLRYHNLMKHARFCCAFNENLSFFELFCRVSLLLSNILGGGHPLMQLSFGVGWMDGWTDGD